MDEILKTLLVGFIVLVTHCLEGITGFGCTVLALPFIAMLLGIKTAVPLLVMLAWILAGYIIFRSWKHIKWKEFGYIVLFVSVGLPVGIFLFDYCPEVILSALLSVFMVVVGAHGVYKTKKEHTKTQNNTEDFEPEAVPAAEQVPIQENHNKSWLIRGTLLLGGMIHGAFGTGGPFVVIYATKALPEKTLFRVTLCLLWFSLNSLLLVKWTFAGNIWTSTTINYTLIALPFLLGGMFLGDWLHHKVNEYYFRISVYAVLTLSGIVMLTKVANKILT